MQASSKAALLVFVLFSACSQGADLSEEDLRRLNEYYENSLMEAEQYNSGLGKMYCPIEDLNSNSLFWIEESEGNLYRINDIRQETQKLYRSKLESAKIKRDDAISNYYQDINHFQVVKESASAQEMLGQLLDRLSKSEKIGFRGQARLPAKGEMAALYALLPRGVDLHYIQNMQRGWNGRREKTIVAIGSFPYRASKEDWSFNVILIIFRKENDRIALEDVYPIADGPMKVLRFQVYDDGFLWDGPEVEISFATFLKEERWLGGISLCQLTSWKEVCQKRGTCNPFEGR